MNDTILPVGKLPPDLLERLLLRAPLEDKRVSVAPGIGFDCAVVDIGEVSLVFKSDPITFASEDIGWYAVQVNANDIATSGATPRWMLVTLMLPEQKTTPRFAESIFDQIYAACRAIRVSVIGGHTEITAGIERPIIAGVMVGEVKTHELLTPARMQTGDHILITKGVPIEATAIVAKEFAERLKASSDISAEEIEEAKNFLYNPGISVLKEAQLAMQCGGVHTMHDPTESGLYGAVWEMAQAGRHELEINLQHVPVPVLSKKICQVMGIDPYASIASGAMLIAVEAEKSLTVRHTLIEAGIACEHIGFVGNPSNSPGVYSFSPEGERYLLPKPPRDEIARLFEEV